MNPRSKKYHESRKANRDGRKSVATNEQMEKTIIEPKENPIPSKKKKPGPETTTAEQDDTGGQNNSGQRSDDD